MFCKNCGSAISDTAVFCPSCGKSVAPSQPVAPSPTEEHTAAPAEYDARKYLVRAVAGVAAIILAIVAIIFLSRLVGTIEGVIKVLSTYDGVVSAVGIAGFVVCGLLLAGCAVLATLPVARFALESGNMNHVSIDRSMAFSVALLIMSIAVWICKLIFYSPAGGNASAALFTIFGTFGETVTGCFVPIIIAIAILYFTRTKLVSSSSARY